MPADHYCSVTIRKDRTLLVQLRGPLRIRKWRGGFDVIRDARCTVNLHHVPRRRLSLLSFWNGTVAWRIYAVWRILSELCGFREEIIFSVTWARNGRFGDMDSLTIGRSCCFRVGDKQPVTMISQDSTASLSVSEGIHFDILE